MVSDRIDDLSVGGAIAHRVLLVEDEPDIADSTRQVLERNGFKVQIAKDGGQAHATFAMHKPDFVILDLILPGESGFEVCEHMKQKDETVPVLILSAIESEESRELANRVGADGYLCKPVDPDKLLQSIGEIAQTVWERHHEVGQPDTSRIRFQCTCGKKYKVSSTHRGKTLTCSDCGAPIHVPRRDA